METLHAGDASVVIDHEHGGRLASLRVGDLELLIGQAENGEDPLGWGLFPMAPWAGRIRHGRFTWGSRSRAVPLDAPPHAIHGTTYTRRWDVLGPGHLGCDLGDLWPWPGRVEQRVELEADQLSLTLEIEADSPMPVSAGWHPWFRRHLAGADVAVTLPAERMWRKDADGIPDGTLVDPAPGPWDDAFTALIGPVELTWPGVLHLAVESDCEHVVVFDEPAGAVCVEPQSAPPDAHNSGEDLVVVEPGAAWAIHSTWAWRRL